MRLWLDPLLCRVALGVLHVFRFLLVLVLGCVSAGAVVITPETTFHGATRSADYKEEWQDDIGGVLHLFVINDGAVSDSVSSVVLNGKPIGDSAGIRWWRAWPESLAPGGCGWVSIKAVGGPLEQGKDVEVEVRMASGGSAKTTTKCVTPPLRIANVLPSPDSSQLYIYVRNDAGEGIQLVQLLVNEKTYAIGKDPSLTLVGTQELGAGGLAILKLALPTPLPILSPLAVRVSGTRAGNPVHVGAGIRLTEPGFVFGSWSTDLPKDQEGMAYARTLGIDQVVTGRNWAANRKMMEQFFIRAMVSGNGGEPKAPEVPMLQEQSGNPDVSAWMVRDEPDLNGKPSTQMHEHTMAYWRNDRDTPTYLNLAISAGFNEYGPIADIACMDHYVMFAPNCIPWTGATRSAEMEEAIQYTDLLKQNTEPVRMSTWAQLAATVWGRQPLQWGVSYQFWAHVMGGAKGIYWFKYGPGFENKFTPQIQTGQRLVKQFEQVRNLCFYGEPLKNVTAVEERVKGRTLNSEHAVVAVVLNNNYEIGGLPMYTRYSLKPVESRVSVPVPAWVKVEQVTQITPDGPLPVDHAESAGVISFNVALNEDMGVFLIGEKDAAAPGKVSGLNAPMRSSDLLVLSWKAATDNFGVRGYTVYRDGEKLTDVFVPVALLRGVDAKPGSYAVEPFDAAGNRGERTEAIQVQ